MIAATLITGVNTSYSPCAFFYFVFYSERQTFGLQSYIIFETLFLCDTTTRFTNSLIHLSLFLADYLPVLEANRAS